MRGRLPALLGDWLAAPSPSFSVKESRLSRADIDALPPMGVRAMQVRISPGSFCAGGPIYGLSPRFQR